MAKGKCFGFSLPRQGKRKTLQLNLKILMRELIKEDIWVFFSSCNSRYTKHEPRSQGGVDDSLKVISVAFPLPGGQETEARQRGTDLKIGRDRNQSMRKRKCIKTFRESLESKKLLISEGS